MDWSKLTRNELREFLIFYEQSPQDDLINQVNKLWNQLQSTDQAVTVTFPVQDLYLATSLSATQSLIDQLRSQKYDPVQLMNIPNETAQQFASILGLLLDDPNLRDRIYRILRILIPK